MARRQIRKTIPTEDRSDLGGLLPRIGVPSLLSLFELERMSGELLLTHDSGQQAVIYIREGSVVDAELPGRGPLRARLSAIMAWEGGSFDFTLKPIRRRDRLGVSTTMLLLDLARLQDEASASRPS